MYNKTKLLCLRTCDNDCPSTEVHDDLFMCKRRNMWFSPVLRFNVILNRDKVKHNRFD